MTERSMKATEMMQRMDLRRRRADMLAAAVLHELRPRIDATDPEELPHRIMRIVHETMLEVMCQRGVEVMTDYTREEAGLPPRGPDGWTIDEVLALEKHRLELLKRPLSFTVPA